MSTKGPRIDYRDELIQTDDLVVFFELAMLG